MKEEDYKYSIEDILFRQDFLNNLDLGWAGQYIENVRYAPELINGNGRIIMQTMQLRDAIGEKSEILVYPEAFSDFHPRFADFHSTLVYHEGYHAREKFEFGAADEGLLGGLSLELMARKFQLEHVNGQNSQAFIDNLKREIGIYQEVMGKIEEFCRRY